MLSDPPLTRILSSLAFDLILCALIIPLFTEEGRGKGGTILKENYNTKHSGKKGEISFKVRQNI